MSDDKLLPCELCDGSGKLFLHGRTSHLWYNCPACLCRRLARLRSEAPQPCLGRDPHCPCQDGDPCHYRDHGDTKAMPLPAEPQDEGDVAAVADVLRRRDLDSESWSDDARAVLAVLRERGYVKVDHHSAIEFAQNLGASMKSLEPRFADVIERNFWSLFDEKAATPPRERPVTEAMIRAAAEAECALNNSDGRPAGPYFNDLRRIRAAIAAALAAERGGT